MPDKTMRLERNFLKGIIANWSHRQWLLGILLLSVFLRIMKLEHQSLWLDELYTMRMSDPKNSVADIFTLSRNADPLSTLYFLLLHFYFKVFDFTALSARLFSVIFGVMGVWAVYLLGKEIRDRKTGVIAAALLSTNYFHIYYSQEARVYTMYFTATCISFFCLLRYFKDPSYRSAIKYGLAAMWMILSHKFGLFTLAAQIIIFITFLFRSRSPVVPAIRHAGLALLIMLAGFSIEIPGLLQMSTSTTSWIPMPSENSFSVIYGNFFGDSFIVSGFIVLFILYYLFYVFQKDEQEVVAAYRDLPVPYLLLLWIMITFLIPYLMSFVKFPMLYNRYMINILPAFILPAAIGVSRINSRLIRYSLIILFSVVSVSETLLAKGYYHKLVKTNFRDAAKTVTDHNAENAGIFTSLPFQYHYYLEHFGNKASVNPYGLPESLDSMQRGLKARKPFWLLEGHGRGNSLSDSIMKYVNHHFEELVSFSDNGAWAKYFVPATDSAKNEVMTLDGENFFEKPQAYDPNIYILDKYPVVSRTIALGPGRYKMIVYARSTPGKPIADVNGQIRIAVNTNAVSTYFINHNSFAKGDTLAFENKDSSCTISVTLLNDTIVEREDRNVIIRRIKLLTN